MHRALRSRVVDQLNVSIVRKPVELIDTSMFRQLEKNDILFIDSST